MSVLRATGKLNYEIKRSKNNKEAEEVLEEFHEAQSQIELMWQKKFMFMYNTLVKKETAKNNMKL